MKIFSLYQPNGDFVTVIKTPLGSYQINFNQSSVKVYNLETAMRLARTFILDQGEIEQ